MGVRPVDARIPVSQDYGSNPTGGLPWDHPTIRRFGNYQPHGHTGVDFATPMNTPVYSVAEGVVRWADWGGKLPGDNSPAGWVARWYLDKVFPGIVVVVEHDDCLVVYAHLNSTPLHPGQRIKAGQRLGNALGQLGKSGNTGGSTGPHLHVEVVPKPFQWFNGMYGRVNPWPYMTGRLLDPTVAVAPPAGAKSPVWFPGAERRPQTLGVTLDRSLPARATWHTTNDRLDPRPSMDDVATYLERMNYEPHLMWDPFTGRVIQFFTADVGARALKAWNEDGARHLQVEIYFTPGLVVGGRRYNTVAETPLKGYRELLEWLDGFGIPRAWPMGPPPRQGVSGTRDVTVWNTRAGHYGHSQVPGNDHTDPGLMPTLTPSGLVPASGGTTATVELDVLEELEMASPEERAAFVTDVAKAVAARVGDAVLDEQFTISGPQAPAVGKRSTPRTKFMWLDHERERQTTILVNETRAARAEVAALATQVAALAAAVGKLLNLEQAEGEVPPAPDPGPFPEPEEPTTLPPGTSVPTITTEGK